MTVPRQHAPGPPGVAVSEPQVSSPLEASPGGEVWRRLRARQAEQAGGGARQSQNGRPTPAAGVDPSSRISRCRRWMDQSGQGDGFTVSSLYQMGRSRRRREGEMVEVEIAGRAEPLLLWRRAAAQQSTQQACRTAQRLPSHPHAQTSGQSWPKGVLTSDTWESDRPRPLCSIRGHEIAPPLIL